MSVSNFDVRRMEQVASFVSFLEAIANPTALAASLKEVDTRVKELKELTSIHKTVIDAERWADAFEAETREKRKVHEEEKAAFVAKMLKDLEDQKQATKRLEDFQQTVNDQFAALKAKEADLAKTKVELDDWSAQLVARAQDLDEREAALAAAVQALEAKVAKVAEVVGGVA